MQLKNRLFLLGAAGVVFGSLVQACATETTSGDDDIVEDAGVVDSGPKKDATADTGAADTGVKDTGADVTIVADTGTDTGTTVDAGPRDSGVDSGPDAGPNRAGELFDPAAPKEGDACPAGTPNFGTLERRCGYCGNQKAFCENGKVGAYGPCSDEKTAATRCLPNAVVGGATCGLCGTTVKTCDPDLCEFSEGVCENEVVNGCPAGEVNYISGVCAGPEELRKQTCSASCQLTAPEACAIPAIDTVDLPTDGSTLTKTFNLSLANDLAERPSASSCPVTLNASTPYHAVLVRNTTATPQVVESWAATPAAATAINTVTAAYVGRKSRPRGADVKACTGTVNDTCSSSPCGASLWSGLVGGQAVTIPPNGTAVIVTNVLSATATSIADTAGKPYAFNVRVKPPEVRAPIDHEIVLPAVNAETTQAIAYASATSTERLPGFDVLCPAVPSASSTPYRFIKLTNNTAAVHKADVWFEGPDSVITYYNRADAPLSNVRSACVGVVDDNCDNGPASADCCLVGADSVTVPANGSAVVFLSKYSTGAGAGTLYVKTTN